MKRVHVALTAGFNRSLTVVALAELLTRQGHLVEAILIVTPFNLRRLRALARSRERGFVARAARRAIGIAPPAQGSRVMAEFLERHDIRARSLRQWARQHHTTVVSVPDLNAPRAIRLIESQRIDGVVYGGGGVLGRPFIAAAGGRILNAHAGPLPAIRGMNACEWSVLFGLEPTVTIHWIDAGIDTGRTIAQAAVPVCPTDDLVSLRERAAVTGVEALCRHVGALAAAAPAARPGAPLSRQCYVLAPALRELAETKLRCRHAAEGA